MKKQKPCLMIDIFFSAFLRFRFWQLWLLELQLNVVQSCALIMDHHYVKSRLFLQFFDFRTTSGGYDKYQLLVWFNYVEIKNLFKVGSRQCFQRKSPLSSRKSFSHFYFTPNYPARPLLTPLNFSLHNLTSTQWGNLLIVQSSRPCWLVASLPGILDFKSTFSMIDQCGDHDQPWVIRDTILIRYVTIRYDILVFSANLFFYELFWDFLTAFLRDFFLRMVPN